jgi:plastocyanin
MPIARRKDTHFVNMSFTALRRGAFPVVASLALVLAACSSTGPSTNTGGEPAEVVDGAVTITAADLAFDAGMIQAPAGEPFTITLVNDDTVPHNVSLYTEDGGSEIVIGEIIDGGTTVEVTVDALEAGEYFFVCDLHTDMSGTLVVGS